MITLSFESSTAVNSGKRPFRVEFHSVTCTKFTTLFKHFICEVRKVEDGEYVFNTMFEFSAQLPSDTEVEVLINIKTPKARSVMKFLDIKLNICDVLTHVHSVPIIMKIVNSIIRGSNLPVSCPIEGNKMYNVTELKLSEDIFPVYTPVMDFNCTGNYYAHKKLIGSYHLQGITARRSKRNK
ncbi:uncharacterized protein LOC131997769 [Stomoxys calcitrans]|uniref:uncharacterized protein LOC131997769 n=1 Tax=Stomoxys calcitrans TaxID=35570 RepID=UPI0027E34D8F|nr:uncharacterized protein LOC131997769 [Stomoxys calcitrans]